MPFGVSVAPEIFHRKMTESFGNLPGVCIYVDDLLIFGETKKIYDDNLKSVLERASQLNIKFNILKCNFEVSQVKYMDHIFQDMV